MFSRAENDADFVLNAATVLLIAEVVSRTTPNKCNGVSAATHEWSQPS